MTRNFTRFSIDLDPVENFMLCVDSSRDAINVVPFRM